MEFALGTAVPAVSQSDATRPIREQTLPFSPSVVATVVTQQDHLQLMVLWRGRPGWFLHGSRRSHFGQRGDLLIAALDYGVIQVEISFDFKRRSVSLPTSTAALQPEENVVLVDGVDTPNPTIVRTLRLDDSGVNLNPESGSLAPLISRSPEVISFIRCNARTNMEGTDRTLARLICDDLPH